MSLLSFVGIFLLASSAVFSAPMGYGSGSLLLDPINSYGGRGQVLLDAGVSSYGNRGSLLLDPINSYGNRGGLLLDPINSYGNRGSLLDAGISSYGGGLINRPVLDVSSNGYGSSYGGYSAPARQFDVVSTLVPKTVEEDSLVNEVQHNLVQQDQIRPHLVNVQKQTNMLVPTVKEVTEQQDVLVQRPSYNTGYGNSGYGASNYGGGYSAPQLDVQHILRKKLVQQNMLVPKIENQLVEQDEVVHTVKDIPSLKTRLQKNFKTVTERRDQLVERPTYISAPVVQFDQSNYGNSYGQGARLLDSRVGY